MNVCKTKSSQQSHLKCTLNLNSRLHNAHLHLKLKHSGALKHQWRILDLKLGTFSRIFQESTHKSGRYRSTFRKGQINYLWQHLSSRLELKCLLKSHLIGMPCLRGYNCNLFSYSVTQV